MKHLLLTIAFVGLIGFVVAGCQSTGRRCGGGACGAKPCASGVCPKKAQAPGCAACAKGKAGEAVWCGSCKAGYVDGNKVACHGCFLAKTGGPACKACAAKTN